jgi:hypothetical protein
MGSNNSGGGVSFLDNSKNMNDPAVLRKIIAELEIENKRLKQENESKGLTNQFSNSFNMGGGQGGQGGSRGGGQVT